MTALERIASIIDAVNRGVGVTVAWLAVLMVIVQFALVLMRYVFGIGSIMTQESVIYMHGILFMLAAAYALLTNAHVRVDIFYRPASRRTKAWIDLLGVIFLLLPFMVILWIYSYPYVAASWAVREVSRETSGIPGVWLLKTCLLIFVVLVALQGISLAFRAILLLAGRTDDHLPSAEEGGA